MHPDPVSEGKRWLAQATRDLDDARYLFEGGRYNQTCFLAQQAAEKALKALLVAGDLELVRGHSVADLCDQAMEMDPRFERLKDQAALDKFYIPTRYPDGLPGGLPADAFTRNDAVGALEMAETVIAEIAKAIGRK